MPYDVENLKLGCGGQFTDQHFINLYNAPEMTARLGVTEFLGWMRGEANSALGEPLRAKYNEKVLDRSFVKNNDNVVRNLYFGGRWFRFSPGNSYMCNRKEAAFIVQKAMEAGYDITAVNAVEFATSGSSNVFLS